MAYIDFIEKIHKKTKRDYIGERVIGVDKAACAEVSKQFGYDYWDGDRKYGYGGYKYDGRWRSVAEDLSEHYALSGSSDVLDLGCGKGFLLHELTQVNPGITVKGIDVSQYALEHAKKEVRSQLTLGNVVSLPFEQDSFDLVLSINVLHNLYVFELFEAIKEMERVGKQKYIVVDSYRNETERMNLMYWQLTCECFYTPEEWQWVFEQCSYSGDFSCIYYE